MADVTWTVGTDITDIDLNDSVSGDGTIAITLQSGTLPDGISLASGILSGAPTDYSDDVTLTFRATSTYGTADTDLEVTILALPAITAIANVSVTVNGDVSIMLSVTGDPVPNITVEGLPTGVTESLGVISGTPSVVGAYNITVTATNSQGSDTETFSITVSAELTAPQITAIGDISVAYNANITPIDVTVTGNPTPAVTVSGLPTGLSYSNGEITGMPTEEGTHEITVTATNSEGDATVTFDITIDAQLTAPIITSISDVSYAYNANITAIDVTVTGNPTPTVTVSGLPSGISYSSADAEITGMSTTAGTHEITVTATNSQDTVTETFDITIEAQLTAPQISAINDVSYGYNATLTAIDVTVTGNPTPTVTVSGLPAGITYENEQITGMTTVVGVHQITITAMNSQDTVTEIFDITISAELTAPQITAISDVSFAYNADITAIAVTVTGNPTPSVTVSGLPTGLTYDSTDAEITGMSTAVGAHQITVTATNSQDTVTEIFDITIESQLTTPQITAISDISVAFNVAITTIDVLVTGNPTPSISVTGLPAGITYTGGEITGMSTVVGAHEITVTATNNQGTVTETFSITVAAELTAPQITAIGDVTYAYNAALTAISVSVTGNPTPSVSVSGLPAGITYENEQITGMSTVAGTHEIIITAMKLAR